ncbi:hypothetical protein LTR37_008778 [Vermiconidia calcicola]|uniref:Uncharacterized protein n=1 Tax=Vermiconidia calcicola TaxID=1690605 RepID=A0ACC3NCB1_9PEZI|nr:hypothetical protein LTR37_008778 [Vermiconidia calcicola]
MNESNDDQESDHGRREEDEQEESSAEESPPAEEPPPKKRKLQLTVALKAQSANESDPLQFNAAVSARKKAAATEGKPADDELVCSNCKKIFSGARRFGPNREILCSPCGQRYGKARSAAAGEGKPVGDEWRPVPQKPQKPLHPFSKSDEQSCNSCKKIFSGKRRIGPDGETLCKPCGERYSKAREAAEEEGKPLDDE